MIEKIDEMAVRSGKTNGWMTMVVLQLVRCPFEIQQPMDRVRRIVLIDG